MNAEVSQVSPAGLAQHQTGLSLFDSGTFEQMLVISAKLADSPILPESLRGIRKQQVFTPFTPEEVASNCFRLVEQASRWGMSPFAISDGCSVVHGKLMWEGKIVSAALSSLLGVRLEFDYSGEGLDRKVVVSGVLPGETKVREVEGTVGDWKTDQWKGSAFDQRLAYRGAREWARRHAPDAILGVHVRDEFDENEMRDATPKPKGIEVREDWEKPEPKTEGEPEKKEELTPKQDPAPKAKTKPLEGKQTVERKTIDCSIDYISHEKPTKSGSVYRIITVKAGKHTTEMGVFGETIARELGALDREEIVEITYTKDDQGLMVIKGWKPIDSLASEIKSGEESPV